MGAAFEEAGRTLDIAPDNPARAMLARIIILLVDEGATDVDQLAIAAIQEMSGTKGTTA